MDNPSKFRIMKKSLLAGLVVAGVTVAAVVNWPFTPIPEKSRDAAVSALGETTLLLKQDSEQPANPTSHAEIPQSLIDATALYLLEQFGERIANKGVQAKLLDERDRLVEAHPDYGLALFAQAVAIAFPELRDEILAVVTKMAAYRDWLENAYLSLREMPALQREGQIWAKRKQLFGDDAEIIWADERIARAAQQQAIHAELEKLDQAHGITLDEAVFQLESAVTEIFGNGLERQLISRGALAASLFGLDSVQSELKAMPAEDRQAAINRMRKKLGYSEEEVEALAARDQERNQRWQTGNAYMAERQALTQRYAGQQLEQELDALRSRYFENAASTIALEEESGFYRFNRPRVYGRN